jgi:hypothetical protein
MTNTTYTLEAFIDDYVWIAKRYPYYHFAPETSNHELIDVYYYNSLSTPLHEVSNLNDIHIPEALIKNLTPELKQRALNNKNVPFMRQLNDNEWIIDEKILK